MTTTLGYNPASQIASSTRSNDAYAWTGAVNVNRGYTTNGLNQYAASGATSLGYDARGNLATSGSATYDYDSENRMIAASGWPGGIYYEPLGRLLYGSGWVNDYDGEQPIAELGAIPRRYVYGAGTDELLVWYEGSGTSDRRFLVADERGSIVAVTDGSGAAR